MDFRSAIVKTIFFDKNIDDIYDMEEYDHALERLEDLAIADTTDEEIGNQAISETFEVMFIKEKENE